jgi:hypothetical protein
MGIYVDGEKIGALANGEVKTFDIPEGSHSIKAKIDWCSSAEKQFSISGEEKKYFKLSGFRFSGVLIPLTLSIFILDKLVEKVYHIDYLIWLVIPGFLVLVYFLTFGRKAYLKLEQTDDWISN